MKTLTITLPTKKAGKLAVFTIEFKSSDFDKVVDAVSLITNIEQLKNNNLWKLL